MGGKVRVAGRVSGGRKRRTRVGEDGRGIRPVEEEVKQYTEKGGSVSLESDKSQQNVVDPSSP